MKNNQSSLKNLWVILFLFIPVAAFTNPYYLLPFGKAKLAPELFFYVLFIPTILLEFFFLRFWFRPKNSWQFFVILLGVHIITYPAMFYVSSLIGPFAEIIPLVVEFQIYKLYFAEPGKSRRDKNRDCFYGSLYANLFSFILGVMLLFVWPDRSARVMATRVTFRSISTAILAYAMDHNGKVPETLEYLVGDTEASTYMEVIPKDPWGRPIRYYYRRDSNGKTWGFLLISNGHDNDADFSEEHLELLYRDDDTFNSEVLNSAINKVRYRTYLWGLIQDGDIILMEYESDILKNKGKKKPHAEPQSSLRE
jgi:type II secretion system (T2SS) protein G